MGAKKVLCQSPHKRPAKVSKSPAPPCHASNPEARKRFVKGYRWFLAMYRCASEMLRAGRTDVEFPPNCFPPALAPRQPVESPAPG